MLPSRFSPARLGGVYQKLRTAIDEGKSTSVFYACQNARYHLASVAGRFFVYVTPDRLSARQAVSVLNEYACGEVVLIPERDDLLINTTVNISPSISERTLALAEILNGKAVGAVVSIEGLMQYFPAPNVFMESVTVLKKGTEVDIDMLTERLVLGGYVATSQVLSEGEFSRRGDVFDVWGTGQELPTRVEFWGDEIESLRVFAPDTMLSVREIEELIISPKSDIMVSQTLASEVVGKLNSMRKKAGKRLAETIDSVVSRLELNPSDPSLVWALPFVRSECATLLDYLPLRSWCICIPGHQIYRDQAS